MRAGLSLFLISALYLGCVADSGLASSSSRSIFSASLSNIVSFVGIVVAIFWSVLLGVIIALIASGQVVLTALGPAVTLESAGLSE
jgi:hypothetical protein